MPGYFSLAAQMGDPLHGADAQVVTPVEPGRDPDEKLIYCRIGYKAKNTSCY